jgi:hypothetical protein
MTGDTRTLPEDARLLPEEKRSGVRARPFSANVKKCFWIKRQAAPFHAMCARPWLGVSFRMRAIERDAVAPSPLQKRRFRR